MAHIRWLVGSGGHPVPEWGMLSPRLGLHAEPVTQERRLLVAQRVEPSRAEDRRGGALVADADLAQCLGGGHGINGNALS